MISYPIAWDSSRVKSLKKEFAVELKFIEILFAYTFEKKWI